MDTLKAPRQFLLSLTTDFPPHLYSLLPPSFLPSLPPSFFRKSLYSPGYLEPANVGQAGLKSMSSSFYLSTVGTDLCHHGQLSDSHSSLFFKIQFSHLLCSLLVLLFIYLQ